MPTTNPLNQNPPYSPYSTFADSLQASSRVLCLIGAGLSAPSGLATWRGTNGLWNNHSTKSLASPRTFREDPVTVWTFYRERLLEALAARPNAAHYALAALAGWHGGWVTVSQNVDGLLEQTEHPKERLLGIHGSLRVVRCTETACDYTTTIDKPEDLPSLLSLSNTTALSRPVTVSDLPHCPKCASLLRPGVVWFGERLAAGAPDSIDDWVAEEPIDLVIAAGTSLNVFPAAEWVHTARACGAALAIFDTEREHGLVEELEEGDWFFEGDIAVILPGIVDLLRQ
ncbi:DHS-like NAD/FAD-binding domain-containing protein [Byssothecium circinans]|uniref:DHS-like NAD/FAD-binding domain-containing protein n=1 Tax=Byssothecium circinans TaxID=147558 RepID=A0A6A5UCS5_9PLEO|nr:DHS-like NAD/FAD-binding domain-containing protein [Byssothecium circinans]